MLAPTQARVAFLLTQDMRPAEIAEALELSRPTVSYHLRRLGVPLESTARRRYDWAAVQRFYDAGHSITDCQRQFGFARCSWTAARRRGVVTARPYAMPIEKLLATTRNRQHLKRRLVELGLKADACEICGIEEWRDAPLSLALHHINGVCGDHRLENLQLLCPNCHSQTENFAGRNRRRARAAAD